MTRRLFGCIEAGGTKFMLGIARDPDTMLRTTRVRTADPARTLGAALEFFAEGQAEFGRYDAIGIAAFGPVDLDMASPTWGRIAGTPKPGWSGVDLAGPFGRALDCPVGLDTDVNGAVLAESLWGAAIGAHTATYVTVGTGIGGGVLIDGRTVHGARHPEMGHMLPRRHAEDQDFAGICPFHRDCLEGLASGPAIAARWGASLSELGVDHPAHAIVAYYLAQLVVAQQAILSPERIVMGGGVLAAAGLIDRVRTQAAYLAGDYFGTGDYAGLVVPPGLGERAGLLGALALAQGACR
jgi:fructokinase